MKIAHVLFIAPITLGTQLAPAQPYEVNWYTIDAGGGRAAGGSFEVVHSIGQPDAGGPLSGGSFVLTGGFIAGLGSSPSCSPADLAEPYGVLNFFDVSAFLQAFSAQSPIADFNSDGQFNFFDVSAFLGAFGAGCP